MVGRTLAWRWVVLLSVGLAGCGGGDGVLIFGRSELSVATTGSGVVVSQPSGIECGVRCKARFEFGTKVVLTASPAQGQVFSGWGGACEGNAPTCSVTLSQSRQVTASFVGGDGSPRYTLGGSLTGLASGASIVLRNNGVSDLLITANGSFQFSQPLPRGATYSITVSTAPSGYLCTVTNGSGSVQGAVSNVQVNCNVLVSGWQPPVEVSGSAASAPRVVMDDQGNGLAVWGQRDAGSTFVSLWFSRYSGATAQWSYPAPVETLPGNSGYGSDESQLVMHPATGRAVLTWLQTHDGTVNVWAMDFDPSTGWGAAVNVESSSGMAGNPRAGVDGSGNAMVVWAQMTPRWSIWASRYVRSTGWSTPELLETNNSVGGVDGDPALAISDGGQVFVAWKATLHNDAINGLWTNRFLPGTGWLGAERRIASLEGGAIRSRPAVAADAQGRALLAWGELDIDGSGTWHSIQTLRYSGGWSATPQTVGVRQASGPAVATPVLAMTPAGAAALSWGIAQNNMLYAAIAPAGGAFGSVSGINTDVTSGDIRSLPAVQINGSGTVMVGWRQGESSASAIHVQRYAEGSGWRREVVAAALSANDTVSGFHAGLGLNASGQALVGWNAFQAGGTKVRARRLVTTP